MAVSTPAFQSWCSTPEFAACREVAQRSVRTVARPRMVAEGHFPAGRALLRRRAARFRRIGAVVALRPARVFTPRAGRICRTDAGGSSPRVARRPIAVAVSGRAIDPLRPAIVRPRRARAWVRHAVRISPTVAEARSPSAAADSIVAAGRCSAIARRTTVVAARRRARR